MFLQEIFQPVGFWTNNFLGNSVFEYLSLLVITGLIFAFLKVFQEIILARLKKLSKRTKNKVDDLVISIVGSFGFLFLLYVGIYVGLKFLYVHPNLEKGLTVLMIGWLVYQVSIIVQIITNHLLAKKSKARGYESSFKLLGQIFKAITWVFGGLLILSNLGINVSSLIAGLGIGGVAAALALQNILGDLFSSFAIHFDRPFVIGDFIVIGEYKGEVKKIGIKTTRIKSLQGEEIVISNKDLTSARVQNFKKMNDRRVSFEFGLEYGLSQENLEKVKQIVSNIIDKTDLARFDRVHLVEFGDSSLNFEAVYFVESPDFSIYRDVHEKILFQMRKEFKDLGASFAYPTQTIYLKNKNN